MASSVLLLSAAGLFVGYLSQLKYLNLGFGRDHVLLVVLDPARSGYKRGQLALPFRELMARLESIPGVHSASIMGASPIQGAGAGRIVSVEGYPQRPEERHRIAVNWVAPKYFETLGIPLLAGRDFTFQDEQRARVLIVNQSFARHYFAADSPIGRHVTVDGDAKAYEIVCVVADAKYIEIRESPPRPMYFNMFQEGKIASQFAMRTTGDPAAVASDVRRMVRESVKNVPISRVLTLTDQVDASIVPERLIATLSALFGALGSLLAGIGVYGLLAYTVARRTNEIGIRMAPGATQRGIVRMVLRDALVTAGAGLALGVPLVYWCRGFAARLNPDLPVANASPVIFAGVVMLALALLAAYLPARRAARVDPMEALRHE
ncbi:MAG TPA: FtsX-like permease family protein [Bryobacteraceae bacterium]|nr:FtsX-like permease family protein [Bryobacteraceae bacterium]